MGSAVWLAALKKQADLSVPLVEEVAADIFMGTFTDKWRRAAVAAISSMDQTVYARYYDLPEPGRLPPVRTKRAANRSQRRWGRKTAEDFTALCVARAAAEASASASPARYVAVNGTILEQAQILTTHNLATLVDVLDLREHMTAVAPELADRALTWVVNRLRHQPDDWHASLQAVKNAAYAWRQAIYYLSLCNQEAQRDALVQLRDRVLTAGGGLSARFGPAVDGLALVIAGGRFGTAGIASQPGQGRRFLGWSTQAHWALRPRTSPARA